MIRADGRWRARIWTGFQVAVALGCLGLLWRTVDGPAAVRSLAAADPAWLALALAALTLQTLLSALRWQLTAARLGVRFGTAHAIRDYYLGQVVNQTLPGGMIGDAGRAYRNRGQAGLLASGQAVAFERLAGQAAVFAIFAAGFVATSLVPGGIDWPDALRAPLAGFVIAGIALPTGFRAATNLPGVVGRSLTGLWRALGTVLSGRGVLTAQAALSVGTAVCNLAAFAFCARAVGVDLTVAAVAALVPLILFAMVIPISLSGWGLREGAAAALLPLAGASASGGLASSIAFGLVFAVSVLPGLVLFWVGPRGANIPARADPQP